MYTPDRWLVLKITGENPHYKIFASWAGSYLQGDSWRLNSGVIKAVEYKEFFLVYGHSGSAYRCYKRAYGITGLSARGVYSELCDHPNVEPLSEMPNMANMDWVLDPNSTV